MDVHSHGQRMKTVAFRTDTSLQINTGHVLRCLTLANALKSKGWECIFVCRAHEGNLIDFIRSNGFQTNVLPVERETTGTSHADWLGATWAADAAQTIDAMSDMALVLIVDHHARNARHETENGSLVLHADPIKNEGDYPPLELEDGILALSRVNLSRLV